MSAHARRVNLFVVLCCACVMLGTGPLRRRATLRAEPPDAATADGDSAEAVYYRITYADGHSEDRATPPDSSEDIVRVMRITRRAAPVGGHEVLSTGRTSVTVVNADHVMRREMRWTGRAWVPVAAPRPAHRSATPPLGARGRTEHIAGGLALRVAQLAERVVDAEADVSEAAGTPAEAAAQQRLDAAHRRLAECRALLNEYRARLALSASDPTGGAEADEVHRLRRRLRALQSRLALFDLATIDAEGELFAQAGRDDAHAARWDLEAVKRMRRALEAEIAAVRRRLSELDGDRP
ncbi:MAG: hypothetical protein KGY99_05895 [Phycisphaerae bacterium]|jgi:hypothetical protein|nr:hypothetical protein [Phycisphaerae bacterium]